MPYNTNAITTSSNGVKDIMFYTNELREMAKKLFDARLLMKIVDDTDTWGIPDIAITHLRSQISEEDWQRVSRLSAIGTTRRVDFLEYGFTRGLNAGFQNYFSPEPIQDPYFELAASTFHEPQALERYPKLHAAALEFDSLRQELEDHLDDLLAKVIFHNLLSKWLRQDEDILRTVFRLGYQAAVNILSDMEEPWPMDVIRNKLPDWDIEADFPGILTPGTS